VDRKLSRFLRVDPETCSLPVVSINHSSCGDLALYHYAGMIGQLSNISLYKIVKT
jgi:hypothetical protein